MKNKNKHIIPDRYICTIFEAIIMFIASELVVDRPTINKPEIKNHEIFGDNLKAVSLAFY